MTSLLIITTVIMFTCRASDAQTINIDAIDSNPVGLITSYLQEKAQPLTIEQALYQYHQGQFQAASKSVLAFGIGAPAVWVAFSIDNSQQFTQSSRFVVGSSWIDHIDTYVKNRQEAAINNYHIGDGVPYSDRPIKSRNLQVDIHFEPGITDVMLHVKTTDPMTLPMYLLSHEQQADRDTLNQYGYGLLYGYVLALLFYNAIVFIGLRDIRYLLYSALLGSFLICNISYTGHGFMWLWPNSVGFQLWGQAFGMNLFGVMGLLFALYFLDIKEKSSHLFQTVLGIIALVVIGYIVAFNLDKPAMAVLTAFIFLSSYIFITMILGFYALKKHHPNAPYYLAAISMGSLGIAVTAMSVWGFIPFNQLTFHAAELGMLVEATLLALALSSHLRKVEAHGIQAEEMARIDLLTEINNRRGFFSLLEGVWKHLNRHKHTASLIMLDLDSFKNLNDTYGHEIGDQALKQVALKLTQHVRTSDIAARWGGEEFVLFLPETNLKEACQMAERIRLSIASNSIQIPSGNIAVTASFGVAEVTTECDSIEKLIDKADKALLVAKKAGKNQVTFLPEIEQKN